MKRPVLAASPVFKGVWPEPIGAGLSRPIFSATQGQEVEEEAQSGAGGGGAEWGWRRRRRAGLEEEAQSAAFDRNNERKQKAERKTPKAAGRGPAPPAPARCVLQGGSQPADGSPFKKVLVAAAAACVQTALDSMAAPPRSVFPDVAARPRRAAAYFS